MGFEELSEVELRKLDEIEAEMEWSSNDIRGFLSRQASFSTDSMLRRGRESLSSPTTPFAYKKIKDRNKTHSAQVGDYGAICPSGKTKSAF